MIPAVSLPDTLIAQKARLFMLKIPYDLYDQ